MILINVKMMLNKIFKRIKNTNFQFTIKSMEQNSCFKNYQFSRLHLKTYYLYRGSRSLNNLFNFKKLTKLTIDFYILVIVYQIGKKLFQNWLL